MFMEIALCFEFNNDAFELNHQSKNQIESDAQQNELHQLQFPFFARIEHMISNEKDEMKGTNLFIISPQLARIKNAYGGCQTIAPFVSDGYLWLIWREKIRVNICDDFLANMAFQSAQGGIQFSCFSSMDKSLVGSRLDQFKLCKEQNKNEKTDSNMHIKQIIGEAFDSMQKSIQDMKLFSLLEFRQELSQKSVNVHKSLLENQSIGGPFQDITISTSATKASSKPNNLRSKFRNSSLKQASKVTPPHQPISLFLDVLPFFRQKLESTAISTPKGAWQDASGTIRGVFIRLFTSQPLLSNHRLKELKPLIIEFRDIRCTTLPGERRNEEYEDNETNFQYFFELKGETLLNGTFKMNQKKEKIYINHSRVILTGLHPEIDFVSRLRFSPLEFELMKTDRTKIELDACMFGNDKSDDDFGVCHPSINTDCITESEEAIPVHKKTLLYLDSVLMPNRKQQMRLSYPLMQCQGRNPCIQARGLPNYNGRIYNDDAYPKRSPEVSISVGIQYYHVPGERRTNVADKKELSFFRIVAVIPNVCVVDHHSKEYINSKAPEASSMLIADILTRLKKIITSVKNRDFLSNNESEELSPHSITGFLLDDALERFVVVLETGDQAIMRKIRLHLARIPDDLQAKQFYNSSIAFEKRQYSSFDELRLKVSLRHLCADGLLYVKHLVSEHTFEGITRLYILCEMCPNFASAVRLDLLPYDYHIRELVEHFCLEHFKI